MRLRKPTKSGGHLAPWPLSTDYYHKSDSAVLNEELSKFSFDAKATLEVWNPQSC